MVYRRKWNGKTHTQNTVVVYASDEEKYQIKNIAEKEQKSMSQYLLDLHIKYYEEAKALC